MTSRKANPSSGRILQPDEISLWKQVTETVTPAGQSGNAENFEDMMRQVDLPQTPRPQTKVAPGGGTDRIPPPVSAKSNAPALGSFDVRRSRQISRGHVSIDGVLDLHGYRQDEAHQALKRFLIMSQAQGARYVTIITGKGRRTVRDDNPFEGPRELGVLRRVVRTWLEEPEFRSLVVSYTTAPRNHGGEGALFVHVRRANRPLRGSGN